MNMNDLHNVSIEHILFVTLSCVISVAILYFVSPNKFVPIDDQKTEWYHSMIKADNPPTIVCHHVCSDNIKELSQELVKKGFVVHTILRTSTDEEDRQRQEMMQNASRPTTPQTPASPTGPGGPRSLRRPSSPGELRGYDASSSSDSNKGRGGGSGGQATIDNFEDEQIFSITLGISPKLLVKLGAIYCHYDVADPALLESALQTRLTLKAMPMLTKITGTSNFQLLHEDVNPNPEVTFVPIPQPATAAASSSPTSPQQSPRGTQKAAPQPTVKVTALDTGGPAAKIDLINTHFGPKIAFYFAWLDFTKQSLYPCFLLWIVTMLSSRSDLTPLIGNLCTLWISCALAFWKTQVPILSQKWAKTKQVDDPETLQMAQSVSVASQRSRVVMVLAANFCTFALLALQFGIVVTFERIKLRFFGRNLFLITLIEAVYYVVSMTFMLCVDRVMVPVLTDWEDFPTHKSRHASAAFKQLVMRLSVFVCPVLYIVTSGLDMSREQWETNILIICHCLLYDKMNRTVTQTLGKSVSKFYQDPLGDVKKEFEAKAEKISVCKEFFVAAPQVPEDPLGGIPSAALPVTPLINPSESIRAPSMRLPPVSEASRRAIRQNSTGSESGGGLSDPPATPAPELIPMISFDPPFDLERRLIKECSLPKFPVDQLYADVVLLLAAGMIVAPLSPLCIPLILLAVWFKSKSAVNKLFHKCRRPLFTEDRDMEPWVSLTENVSILAIVANVGTLYMFLIDRSVPGSFTISTVGVVPQIFQLLNSLFGLNNQSALPAFFWLVCIEHIVLLVRCMILPGVLAANAGHAVEARLALEKLVELKENIATRMFRLEMLSQEGFFNKVGIGATEEWKAKLKLADIQSRVGVSMSPLLFTSLTLLPYCCSFVFGIPWWVTVIPLSMVCSLYHNRINRQKYTAALSMVADPYVFDIIRKEFPGFVFETDMERSEWVNRMLRHTWAALVEYGIRKIRNVMDPMLEQQKPSFAKHLLLSKLSLGTEPPSILGIRVLQGVPGSNMVEVDVDFKWISNMDVAISLGLAVGGEMMVGVSNFRFSGTARVQLLPLIPAIPPFAVGKVTFFKKPYVDFSLNFGDADLMDSGYSTGNISSAIQRVLKSVLENMVIYPKWMQVEMIPNASRYMEGPVELFTVAPPEGILCVNVMSCSDLVVGDLTTSDPYVVLKVRDEEEYKTDVIYKTLNPVWTNAQFSFMITDKKVEKLHAEVWDKDLGSQGTFLGQVDVYLHDLIEGVPKPMNMVLLNVDTGSICMELTYYSIGSGPNKSKNENSTIYDVSLADLFTDSEFNDMGLENMDDVGIPDSNNNHTNDCDDNSEADGPLTARSQHSQASSRVLGSRGPHPLRTYASNASNVSSGGTGAAGGGSTRPTSASGVLASLGIPQTVAPKRIIVVGVLTVSEIGFDKLKSVRTALSSTHYFAPYVLCTLGQNRKQTSIAPSKGQSFKFKDTFNFVVSNAEQDVLQVKLKFISSLGVHTTIASCLIRVHTVANAPNAAMTHVENVYPDRMTATGEMTVHLQYRASWVGNKRASLA